MEEVERRCQMTFHFRIPYPSILLHFSLPHLLHGFGLQGIVNDCFVISPCRSNHQQTSFIPLFSLFTLLLYILGGFSFPFACTSHSGGILLASVGIVMEVVTPCLAHWVVLRKFVPALSIGMTCPKVQYKVSPLALEPWDRIVPLLLGGSWTSNHHI